jgi:hypothetical protein
MTVADLDRFVEHFHQKFNMYGEAENNRRLDLMREEWDELVEAIGSGDPLKIGHESADLIFTVWGTCHVRGINLELWLEAVCRANLDKMPNPSGGKPTKPPAWLPPADRVERLERARAKVGREESAGNGYAWGCLLDALHQTMNTLREIESRNRMMRGVVDRLPTDAQGLPVIAGDTLYRRVNGRVVDGALGHDGERYFVWERTQNGRKVSDFDNGTWYAVAESVPLGGGDA